MKMLQELKSNLPSYIFNFLQMFVNVLIGFLMGVRIEMIIALISVFILVKQRSGKQMHYKSPPKCSISTTLLFIAFYGLTYIDCVIAIIVAVIAALSTTEYANTKNYFLYSNEKHKEKYREMKKYIRECEDNTILEEYGRRLKKIECTYKARFKAPYYRIYEMYFLENAKFKEIIEELNMYDNHELIRALDLIFMIFNEYMIEINEFDNLKENEELAVQS